MTTKKMRRLAVVGGTAWMVVAGYGLNRAMSENDEGWRVGYAVFSLALVLAVVSTVMLAAFVSRRGERPRLRMAGLVVSGAGCALAVVGAWALPVWMTLLGVGFTMIGIASGAVGGRVLAVLGAAQLLAIAALVAGIEAEVGRRDEWGDYPAAGGIALLVVAGLTIAAIIRLAQNTGRLKTLP